MEWIQDILLVAFIGVAVSLVMGGVGTRRRGRRGLRDDGGGVGIDLVGGDDALPHTHGHGHGHGHGDGGGWFDGGGHHHGGDFGGGHHH